MTPKEQMAPFYRRDGSKRELTATDYATISGLRFNQARRVLTDGVKTGVFARQTLPGNCKIAVFSLNEWR